MPPLLWYIAMVQMCELVGWTNRAVAVVDVAAVAVTIAAAIAVAIANKHFNL